MRSMPKATTFLIIGFLVLFAVVFSARTQETPTITAEDIHDCMIYEDCVVEGVVLSVKWEKIPYKDFFHDVTHPYLLSKKQKFGVFEFEVKKKLIGNLNSSKITLYSFNNYENWLSDIEEGYRYIFSLRHHIYKGVVYGIMGGLKCRFLIKGDTFLRGRKSDPIQTGRVSDLYKAIDEIKRKRSIDTITDEAELIVRGRVKERWTTDDTLSSGLNKNIEKIRLSVDEYLKGNLEDDEVEFSVIYMATYNPFWKSRFPEVTPGEEWLVFLKWAEEPGYYPFAGVNGMFKVEGDKLVRVNRASRITMDRTLEKMKNITRNEASGSGKK